MIPILEKPVEDEMITSWIAYIAELNGIPLNTFYTILLGMERHKNNKRTPRIEYLEHLEYICQMEAKSKLFPDIETIMRQHTDFYAALSFMSDGTQGKYSEAYLRHPKRKANITYFFPFPADQLYRVCPECIMEDIEIYGRPVMHVPHQDVAVKCCWKHGVKLQSLSDCEIIEPMSEIEREIAIFAHELYLNPIITTYDLVRECMLKKLDGMGLSVQKACKTAIAEGYLDTGDEKLVNRHYSRWKVDRVRYLLRVLTWLYGSADNFRKEIPEVAFEIPENDEFEVIGHSGVLYEFRCRTCGHVFHMHPYAVRIGTPCPACAEKLSEAEIYQRYLSRYEDGEYEFVDSKFKKIRHKPCGMITAAKLSSRCWNNSQCIKCRERDILEWQELVDSSEKKYRVKEIIRKPKGRAALNIEDIEGGFEFQRLCGTIVREGGIPSNMFDEIAEKRVGMQRRNKDGKLITIVAYRTNLDMDVQFEDGTIVQMTYNGFLQGHGQKKETREKRMQEKKKNRQGLYMQIVEYRKIKSIDVQFEDGTIVETDYFKFRNGTVFHPGYDVTEHMLNHRKTRSNKVVYKGTNG